MTLANLARQHRFLDRAAFIVASGRSGSTLLRSLLDGHPQLSVWPFEFHYYTLWQQAMGDRVSAKVGDLRQAFEERELRNFDGYSADLGGRRYDFDPERVAVLRGTLDEWAGATATRREYLQLLMWAYVRAFGLGRDPERWLVTINQPSDRLAEDFPDARVLAAVRHPIHTYVSTKRYYFKAADLTRKDRSAVYRPRAANSAYALGLLETAVSPIIHTSDWLQAWSGRARILQVRLERLQVDTAAAMGEVAAFLGVANDPILTRATLNGRPHGSNMSSGEDSGGRVRSDNWVESQQYLGDLSPFEARWVARLLGPDCDAFGYGAPDVPPAGGLSLFKPMRHEFPSGNGAERPLKRALRWAASIYSYVVNRGVLLAYRRRHVHTRWPYAK